MSGDPTAEGGLAARGGAGAGPSEQDPGLAELLASASQGHDPAWRRLVDLYARRVFALAKSRCRNADVAEDITQSVFVTVASKLGHGQYVEQGRFEAWLFRVAMNRVRDYVRQAKRHAGFGLSEAGSEQQPADPQPHRGAEELDALRLAIEQLSDSDREIVELRHHGGLSFKQMADLLDEPMGTLLARHHRALRKLKEILEQPGNGGGFESGDTDGQRGGVR